MPINLNDMMDIQSGAAGSGNFGHAGRPGQVGGSQPNNGGKVDWRIAKKSFGGRKHEWGITLPDGRNVILRMILQKDGMNQTVSKHWEVFVEGIRKFPGKNFKNALAAKKAIEKHYKLQPKESVWKKGFIEDIIKKPEAEIGKQQLKDFVERIQPRHDRPQAAQPLGTQEQIGQSPLATSPPRNVEGLGGGVNGTYIATLENGEKGVWKPKDEEAKEFPKVAGTMYLREALGYDVAKAVGYTDLVPETVVREIDGKVGSIMKFVEGASLGRTRGQSRHWEKGDRDQIERAAAFDYLIGNSDRHGGNYMFTRENGKYKYHLIDNGFSMYPANFSVGKGSHFFEMVSTHGASVSQSVKDTWSKNWDKVEAAMRMRRMPEADIKRAQGRLSKLLLATKWSRV